MNPSEHYLHRDQTPHYIEPGFDSHYLRCEEEEEDETEEMERLKRMQIRIEEEMKQDKKTENPAG